MNVKKITQCIESFVEEHTVNGTIAIAIGDKLVFGEGFGLADHQSNMRCDLYTQFNIASVTKQFTAAALLKVLYDANPSVKALNKALNRPLSAYPTREDDLWKGTMPEWAERVNLHHLLTHTSGVVNYTEMDAFWDIYKIKEPSLLDVLGLFKNSSLHFQPGILKTIKS